ncbi:YicC family protein [Alkalicella caledoniensis]|uniref:YicC family protein n=1 Tax=Alkalicella caledoniensis TaxID=2731377 RepID=A0A7G9WCC4_ALKCA|nr:YicC/YloC family endoribonuclease [Alkalicella caledoniensis]QNO16336.1 YicC family protein [Alkalicella caledoniensis]
MIRSMTGFSRQIVEIASETVTIEIKSVNNRYLDIVVKMPDDFSFIEEEIKSVVRKSVKRGRIDIKLKWKNNLGSSGQEINKELLIHLVNQSRLVAEELNMDAPTNIDRLLLVNGVVTDKKVVIEENFIKESIISSLKTGLKEFNSMRFDEGQRLKEDIEYRLNVIRELLAGIKDSQNTVVEEYREKLGQRVSKLKTEGLEFDESRLLSEIALFAERCSITEEIVRLESHLIEFVKTVNTGDSVGRKLDFLLQEINREVNTIGSKANNYNIAKIVVDIKGEAEKIREQIQNIE